MGSITPPFSSLESLCWSSPIGNPWRHCVSMAIPMRY
jgi:hypothetical protein